MSPAERVSRRTVIAAAACVPALSGCDRALSWLSDSLGGGLPKAFEAPALDVVDETQHLLARTSFGVWPGDWERAKRMGKQAYLDEQLEPSAIDDAACDVRAGAIDVVHLGEGLFELPSDQIEIQLARHALLRACYSKRQLQEVMVELWSDHFHIAIGKSLCQKLLPLHDRDVIRQHALGNFRELLSATATSPAMLVYLDGRDNKQENDSVRPNENYARELLELHTMGVRGGYTQADVMEAARCLTGFVVREEWAPGLVEFVPERHDSGEKRVLGETIRSGGGRSDLDRLLDILAAHPRTAEHVSRKIAATFVDDDPPETLVAAAAATFTASRGDIRAVLRTVLESEAFDQHKRSKIKRPFRFVVSALRALGADTHAKGALLSWLGRMGHAPYGWPTPDGYPARGEAWLATLLQRFRFAFELTSGAIEDTRVDLAHLAEAVCHDNRLAGLVAHSLGRLPQGSERELFSENAAQTLASTLSSPAFQRY